MKKYPCPCCENYTFSEKPPKTFDICPVCFWEDDYVQFNDPDFKGGANHVSLNQAKKNYLKFGAIEKRFLKYVRKPFDCELSKNNKSYQD